MSTVIKKKTRTKIVLVTAPVELIAYLEGEINVKQKDTYSSTVRSARKEM